MLLLYLQCFYLVVFAGTTAAHLSVTQSTNDSEAGSSDPITTTLTITKTKKLRKQITKSVNCTLMSHGRVYKKSEKCRGDYLHQLFYSKQTQKKRKL